jgi:hypothetical protein
MAVLITSARTAGSRGVYWAETPGGEVQVKAGRPCPDLDRLLSRSGFDEWACVGAVSSGCSRLADDAARTRRELVERYVRGIGYMCYHSRAAGEGEPSLLILGIPEDAALRLGRMLEQETVLVGRRGGCPEERRCGIAADRPWTFGPRRRVAA